MPKRPIKPRTERIVEEFFPLEPSDIKHSVEKPVKQINPATLTKIETVGQSLIDQTIEKKLKKTKSKIKKTSGKKTRKKSILKDKSEKVADFSAPKSKLKADGYELVITEKPQAAMKIASALGKVTARNVAGVPYYELSRQGKEIVVACAVGHLFTLSQIARGVGGEPAFNIKWVPNYMVRKKDFSKKYYDVLVSLVKGASAVTVATDYDIEGEVIGLNVVRFIAGLPDASRMKFSTLTDKELNDSYEKKSSTLNWGQAIAGETRHYLDWFYGINLSRALMNAIKTTGKFKVMSIGRVQGPALNMIVQKERQISTFKSKKYWQVFITLEDPEITLQHNKDIFKKSDLEKFYALKGQTAIASTEKKEQTLPPNPPFNLTALQIEAYKLFGINPAKTLQLAQSLYLGGLISYPRTSSQKLPPSIGYREILDRLAAKYKVEHLTTRKNPVEGKKSDPAHPSIFPTGNFSESLSDDEKKIYELIVKRFLSLFCEDAIIDNKTIKVQVGVEEKYVNDKKESSYKNGVRNDLQLGIEKLIFTLKGASVREKGWLSIYPIKIVESEVPDVNGKVKIVSVADEEKETQPPRRFSPASIVSELEKRNLGTKATRASILETLYDRGYVKEQSIKATPLGVSLIGTLEKYSPIIIDEDLTRKFEREMEEIQQMKSNQLAKEEKMIAEAKQTIIQISEQFRAQEKVIGAELLDAQGEAWKQEREENKLTLCPKCNKGSLQIMYSRKIGRSFIGCSNYPACKNTYSLPPNSLIKKTDKTCESCGFPMLMSIKKGKRPWFFCFNSDCEINKKRLDEYRRKKNMEAEENGQSSE